MNSPNSLTNCGQLITLQRTHNLDLVCNSYTQVMYNTNDVRHVCSNNQLIQIGYLMEATKYK